MRYFLKFFGVILLLTLLCFPVTAKAAQTDTEGYIQRMIQYYLNHQEAADEEIRLLLNHLGQIDPQQERLWEKIMGSWSYVNSRMEVSQGILPEGLPQDDSLCIVIMGYGLNRDGSMKDELIDRLVVGLSSAMKYPNAYVAVTGGETSDVKGITEAGQMACWLLDRGLSSDRLIVEPKAYSTTENAVKVHQILRDQYPSVRNLAIVTSDYHIHRSCTMFTTMSHYGASLYGCPPMKVVGSAVNATGKPRETLYSQAMGISMITGIPLDTAPETQPELAD